MYPHARHRKSLLVEYDNEAKTLYIQGKKPWKLTGDSQPAAVEHLYKLSLRDIWEDRAVSILQAVATKTNKPLSDVSRTVNALFSGSREYEKSIMRTRRGHYGFKLD